MISTAKTKLHMFTDIGFILVSVKNKLLGRKILKTKLLMLGIQGCGVSGCGVSKCYIQNPSPISALSVKSTHLPF